MSSAGSPLFKRYLKLYKKHPGSRIFAPLAHLYRAMGEREKALQICRKGVKEHPYFASGHIALALIFLDMNKPEQAIELLEKAVQLSPENLLAHKVLAQTWLQLKNPEKTLQAYKRVLFLDPENKKAIEIVQKMEPMTAKDYPDAGFAFKNLQDTAQYITATNVNEQDAPIIHPIPKGSRPTSIKEFEAQSAIAEALIYRKEFDRAELFLKEMSNVYSYQDKWNRQIQVMEKKLSRMRNMNTQASLSSPIQEGVNGGRTKDITDDTLKKSSSIPDKNQRKIQRLRQIMKHIEKVSMEINNRI